MDGLSGNKRKWMACSTAKPEAIALPYLPEELLELILKRLILADYIRFGAVCKQWNRVFVQQRHPPAPQIPWVWTAPFKGLYEKGYNRFYSPSEKRYYDLNLPRRGGGSYCVGSQKGWLIVIREGFHSRAQLVNPFSGEVLKLPMICSYHFRFDRIVLSLPPTHPCCIAACVDGHGSLYLCRPMGHQSRWVLIPMIRKTYHAAIFYNGSLYVLAAEGELYLVEIASPDEVDKYRNSDLDLEPYLPKCCKVVDSPQGEAAFLGSKSDRSGGFEPFTLIEFGGQLLLLRFFVESDRQEFLVFRSNFELGKWEQLESLKHPLLFSSEGCESFMAHPPPGFTHNNANGMIFRQLGAEDNLLFHSALPYSHIWLTPSPW